MVSRETMAAFPAESSAAPLHSQHRACISRPECRTTPCIVIDLCNRPQQCSPLGVQHFRYPGRRPSVDVSLGTPPCNQTWWMPIGGYFVREICLPTGCAHNLADCRLPATWPRRAASATRLHTHDRVTGSPVWAARPARLIRRPVGAAWPVSGAQRIFRTLQWLLAPGVPIDQSLVHAAAM